MPALANLPSYDPTCYLCPGNMRAGGVTNPDYKGVFIFDNDFAAVLPGAGVPNDESDPVFEVTPANGVARVICFSERHDRSMPDLTQAEIRAIVDAWAEQTAELGQGYPSVQIFENKGATMGCSNPHPHGQVWATSFVPDEVATEDQHQRAYFAEHGRPMLLDIAAREFEAKLRIVTANQDWLAIVPFWASWPFETLLLPRFAVSQMSGLGETARDTLAEITQTLTRCYDNLFGVSFPYSMGWHGAPFDGQDDAPWQLHAHFYPPLLRSATVRKFMVGFEMLAEAQRDLTPEQAAERLRAALAQ